MSNYKVGNVLSAKKNVRNTYEEAVITNTSQRYDEYKVLFMNYSEKNGYHFVLDARKEENIEDAYQESMTPHFCLIENLYNMLNHYDLHLLGMQHSPRYDTKTIYLKAGNKYLQIFVLNSEDIYEQIHDGKMFVYVYEANDFEDLKLSEEGTFCFFENNESLQLSTEIQHGENIGFLAKLKGSSYSNHVFIIRHVKNTRKDNGCIILGWNHFKLCDSLDEFKDMIKKEKNNEQL